MNAPIPPQALVRPAGLPEDTDPQETAEWREAFLALVATEGPERARFVLDELARMARAQRVGWQPGLNTPYVNTVAVQDQGVFPGDLAIEERLASIMRWNALAMVVRANQAYGELGGHIASYASAADLFETGFNHFFHAREGLSAGQHRGDLVFFQPHSAPGVYARAFLEGRLSEQDLMHYRQEITAPGVGARGLSSYPHPWLMPDFWQFPTGSMGIGPISSIYHARFMRYLTHRGLLDCAGRKDTEGRTAMRRVWGVFGDGEMDEPESMSALTLAAREGLDNLVWVVNCNLQRLDGPVRGNGRIIDELERLFAGAGWNVVKLVWGSDWDGLFARDLTGALVRTLEGTVDGQMQTFAAKDGRFNRDNFFGQNPELAALAQGMTDEQIDRLKRGGHDLVKIHAAYAAAAAHKGQPTVILAHTKKGYGMGAAGQGKMTTHSQKKLDDGDLIEFRNRFNLPLSDAQATGLAFYKPQEDSAEMQYLRRHRQQLGGYLPRRETACDALPVPPIASYAQFALAADGKEMSTTMAFVRMLGTLLKDTALGPRIVPIVADEARTFGMANLFKQVGIYSSVGQRYAPEDIGSVLSYREALDGQILEEGISEAGAIASWTAAATSYSVHGLAMLPFYIYYSMFGFQRVGDAIWAAADQRARGFLLVHLGPHHAGPAHRTHRGRRGAHLWHGQPVQAGGHLQQRGPALRARRHRIGAELPRGAGRPDSGRRHQRGRCHRQLDGRGHQLQRARPGHAAVLHLLLHVWLPAGGRRHLGGCRPARARLPAGRHLGPHHAGRRGPAAPGRQQPPRGRHHPQLQGLRPGLRGRDGRHRGRRYARDGDRAARRLLLRHADERELRPARPASRSG